MSETDASETAEKFDIENENYVEETSNTNKNSYRSFIWDYFDIISKRDKTAMCNLCHKQFSFSTTTANLAKHLRRIHNVHKPDQNKDQISRRRSSPVWKYFKKIEDEDGKSAECKICFQRLFHTNSTSNLKRHLVNKHKGINIEELRKTQELLFSNDVVAFEIENDEPEAEAEEENGMETNAVYLDEFIEEVKAAKQKPKKLKLKNEFKANHCQSSPPFTNRQSSGDLQISTNKSLDFFAKYLISLLEKLPESTSIKLQSEFIVKTIDASANCYQEKEVLQNITKLDNAFKITVSTENNDNQIEIENKE